MLRHFKKDPANLAIAWEQYRSEQHHRYSNAALRMQHGLKIQAEEQEQLLAHSRAITEALPDESNPIAIGQAEAVASEDAAMPVLPANVVAFPSREGVAEKAAFASQDERDRFFPFSFSSSPPANNSQAPLLPNDCSLTKAAASAPTDSDGCAENPDAYRVWQPKPVEGEALQPGQLQEKLAALTQKLSMPKPKQEPQRQPKNELEELNEWLADPILREVMPRVMRSNELP